MVPEEKAETSAKHGHIADRTEILNVGLAVDDGYEKTVALFPGMENLDKNTLNSMVEEKQSSLPDPMVERVAEENRAALYGNYFDIKQLDVEEGRKQSVVDVPLPDNANNTDGFMPLNDLPPEDLNSLPYMVHHYKTEKKKTGKIWIAVMIAVLIAGGGYYGYSQYKQKQERLAREAEVAEYNSEIEEAEKLLGTMVEMVGAMNDILVNEQSLYYSHAISLFGNDMDFYDEIFNEISESNLDMLQYIYKPGQESIYSYEEAKDLLDQDLAESLNKVEQNKIDIVPEVDQMKGYPEEIGMDLVSLYEVEFVTLMNDYEQQRTMMSVSANEDHNGSQGIINHYDAVQEVKTAFDQTFETLTTKSETIKSSLSALYLDE